MCSKPGFTDHRGCLAVVGRARGDRPRIHVVTYLVRRPIVPGEGPRRRGAARIGGSRLSGEPLRELAQPPPRVLVVSLSVGARLARAVVVDAADAVELRVADQPQ